MRNAMKQLGMGLGVLFALGTSSAALAYPSLQCPDVCSCSSSCAQLCYLGHSWTTCSSEVCVDYCRGSAPQASASQSQSSSTQDEQEQQDASQDVCSEKTEQARSAKS